MKLYVVADLAGAPVQVELSEHARYVARYVGANSKNKDGASMWGIVIKIMVPFWVP